MTDIRRRTAAGLKAGDTFTLTRTFTEQDVAAFATITRDHNPIHFHEGFVKSKGFDARVCHGLLVGGMITEIGGQIGWLASGMSFRFKKPVYLNDTVACRFTLLQVDEKDSAKAEAIFTNQHGEIVLQASLYGLLPNLQERKILEGLLKDS